MGGSFGGKTEYIIEPVCAFLAHATRRPVKLLLDREECMVATMVRPATWTTIRTACTPDGMLLDFEAASTLDSGAYASSTPDYSIHMCKKVTKLYRVPHYQHQSRAVLTNTPVGGAARGWGAPEMAGGHRDPHGPGGGRAAARPGRAPPQEHGRALRHRPRDRPAARRRARARVPRARRRGLRLGGAPGPPRRAGSPAARRRRGRRRAQERHVRRLPRGQSHGAQDERGRHLRAQRQPARPRLRHRDDDEGHRRRGARRASGPHRRGRGRHGDDAVRLRHLRQPRDLRRRRVRPRDGREGQGPAPRGRRRAAQGAGRAPLHA